MQWLCRRQRWVQWWLLSWATTLLCWATWLPRACRLLQPLHLLPQCTWPRTCTPSPSPLLQLPLWSLSGTIAWRWRPVALLLTRQRTWALPLPATSMTACTGQCQQPPRLPPGSCRGSTSWLGRALQPWLAWPLRLALPWAASCRGRLLWLGRCPLLWLLQPWQSSSASSRRWWTLLAALLPLPLQSSTGSCTLLAAWWWMTFTWLWALPARLAQPLAQSWTGTFTLPGRGCPQWAPRSSPASVQAQPALAAG